MDKNMKAMKILSDDLISTIKKLLETSTFCHMETGVVTEILSGNQYHVKINGKVYIAKSRFDLEVNDVVKILISGKNYNDLYIIY